MLYFSLSRCSQYSASSCGLEYSFIHSLIHFPDSSFWWWALDRVLGRQWGQDRQRIPSRESSRHLVRRSVNCCSIKFTDTTSPRARTSQRTVDCGRE